MVATNGRGVVDGMRCAPNAVEFDFTSKRELPIAAAEARAAIDRGRSCWIDLDASDPDAVRATLRHLGVNALVIEHALTSTVDGRGDAYEDCLHVAVSAASFEAGQLNTSQVDIILGEGFIVTLHRGDVAFLDQVRKRYSNDFQKFAKTLSFLLYEIWDCMLESYLRVLRAIEDGVESVQQQVLVTTDDEMFGRVATITREALLFRKLVLTSREVLHELAVRRSSFVSETAQPYLNNMVATLDRLGADLAVERETLAEMLNLYMGIVCHRTNAIVKRLTVLSMIFLPLTFLCGVYGMNFEHLPELHWRLGYAYFWMLAASIAGGLVLLMKRNAWI